MQIPSPIVATIDVQQTAPPGSKYEFGMFIKYIRALIYRTLPPAKVSISLIWGEGESDRQTVSFTAVTKEYKKFPLNFTSQADANAASLEIVGTGTGIFISAPCH